MQECEFPVTIKPQRDNRVESEESSEGDSREREREREKDGVFLLAGRIRDGSNYVIPRAVPSSAFGFGRWRAIGSRARRRFFLALAFGAFRISQSSDTRSAHGISLSRARVAALSHQARRCRVVIVAVVVIVIFAVVVIADARPPTFASLRKKRWHGWKGRKRRQRTQSRPVTIDFHRFLSSSLSSFLNFKPRHVENRPDVR